MGSWRLPMKGRGGGVLIGYQINVEVVSKFKNDCSGSVSSPSLRMDHVGKQDIYISYRKRQMQEICIHDSL